MATAKSPAMLFYLDNARSVADEEHRAAAARSGRRAAYDRALDAMDPEMAKQVKENAPRGINENYAREIMELHTLGVDGGYTQKDVTELARVADGLVDQRRPGTAARRGRGRVPFPRPPARHRREDHPRAHPSGRRRHRGRRDDDPHPRASPCDGAAHIALQLCQRSSPTTRRSALVEPRREEVFLSTDGDLRETVRAVVTSPEFFEPRYYRAKVKSPFEYVVSAVRAIDGTTDGTAVARQLAQMGEPLYLCQPPTGYSDRADAWVNSGRARRAAELRPRAGGRRAARHQRGAAPPDLPETDAARCEDDRRRALARVLLNGSLSRSEPRDDLESDSGATTVARRADWHGDGVSSGQWQTPCRRSRGCILGSPEFRRNEPLDRATGRSS